MQAYFRSLSVEARYDRFLGGMSKLPESVLDHFVRPACADRFTVLATITSDDAEKIIGEARYVLDARPSQAELALSVNDRWRGRGIGKALAKHLEAHAMASGTRCLFGEMLRSNERICRFARAFGYVPAPAADGRLIRFEKRLAA